MSGLERWWCVTGAWHYVGDDCDCAVADPQRSPGPGDETCHVPAGEAVRVDLMYPVTAAVNALGIHLSLWRRRDYPGQPEATRAGTSAVTAIDVALRELHQLRSRLVTEVRQHQDAEPPIVPRDTAGQPE